MRKRKKLEPHANHRGSWLRRVLVILAILALLPVLLIGLFRWVDPPSSAFIEQYRVTRLWHPKAPALNHCWEDYAAMSPAMALAVVAAEDQKFPDHWGFDVRALQSAFKSNQKGRKTKGASTITQQTAKNLFLWGGRSYVRKALEAYLTVWIELLWPKRRILEVYLNVAEFAPGLYGACAAGPQLFGRSVAKLSSSQAALMAAVLPSPRRMHADHPSRYVRRRAAEIEAAMRALGSEYLVDLR